MGLGETPLITFHESIEEPVTILFPGTLACHEIDGAQESYDIDSGRTSSGVVEIIEPPCILRYRELLDVRVAVQPHNWQVAQITAQIVADPRDPGPVDESEKSVRVGSKSLDQLGRRAFERFRLGSERLRTVCRSHQRNGDHSEHIDEVAELHTMHVFPFCLAVRRLRSLHDAR